MPLAAIVCPRAWQGSAHLVQPRGIDQREFDVPTRTMRQPAAHGRGLVGGATVHDEMHLEIFVVGALKHAQESEELPAAVRREAPRDERPDGDGQGGEQRRGPVPQVVMKVSFDLSAAIATGDHWCGSSRRGRNSSLSRKPGSDARGQPLRR